MSENDKSITESVFGETSEVTAKKETPEGAAETAVKKETAETTAVLRFKEDPDHILSVCCWSDAYWSDPEAEGEDLDVNGNEIELKSGGYIYEVTAEWDTGKSGYGGTAHYSFYIKVLE